MLILNQLLEGFIIGWNLVFVALSHVRLQLVRSVKLLKAEGAVEELDVEVASLMVSPVAISDELLATVFAREWFFLGVRSDVMDQTCLVL